MSIPIEQWGRDHWSMLAFIECLCVDFNGKLGTKSCNLRTNETTHPGHGRGIGVQAWKPTNGTRLKDEQLAQHDDWDCLQDLETAGLVVNIGSGLQPVFKLTEKGWSLSAALRAHRGNGQSYTTFQPAAQPLALLAQCLSLKGIADSIISKDGTRFWIRVIAPDRRYVDVEGDTLEEAIAEFAKQLL